MIGKFLRNLSFGKHPFRCWTHYKSSRPHKHGGYVEVNFYYTGYSELPHYYRHTLLDLAQYVGGP